MDQAVPVQVIQRRRQREADVHAFIHRQAVAGLQFMAQGAGRVRYGVLEWWSDGEWGRWARSITPSLQDSITPLPAGRVRQFHDIVIEPGGVIAADVEHGYLAGVAPGNRFVAFETFKLAFVGVVGVEVAAVDDLDGAVFAQDVPRQPDFAVATSADAAEQFVVGDRGWWIGH